MAFDLRIPELGSREVRRERRMSRAEHEEHERREHRDRDPLDKLPGQMMNIAGAAVVGGMTIGILGAMHK